MALLVTKGSEFTWLRWLHENFGVPVINSTTAITIVRVCMKHELTKHIGVDASFTRSQCQQSTICLQYVPLELPSARFLHQDPN